MSTRPKLVARKKRLRSRVPQFCAMRPREKGWRCSGAWLSGRITMTTRVASREPARISTKLARQPQVSLSQAPSSGAEAMVIVTRLLSRENSFTWRSPS